MARYSYGKPSGSSGRMKKRRLADAITNQAGLGEAYNSATKPSKNDPHNYGPKPMDPTQGGPRHQTGRRKVTKVTYASMARKKRRRTSDAWIG